MWHNLFRNLFSVPSSPPLAAVDDFDDDFDVDAGGDHPQSRIKYQYVRASGLPSQIRAAANDGTLPPWGTSADGEKWFRIAEPIDDENAIDAELQDSYSVADYDDAELSALDEIAQLDAEADAIVRDFNARCERMILARGDAFEPYSEWSPGHDD